MYIVLGATGHVGGCVIDTLLAGGHAVTGVAHDADGAARLRARGATAEVVDVRDSDALRAIFRTGQRAFLLNPPADPSTDTDREETATANAIAAAVAGSGLEKVVVESTYGAEPGEAIGDSSVLWNFEQAVAATGVPSAINRGAYYFSNFDELIEPARGGTLPSMFPADMVMPMVAPADLGVYAAERLVNDETGARFVEGPRRYTFTDVAAVFADVLGRPVTVDVVPPDRHEAAFRKQGFSAPAARAYARMTAAGIDHLAKPDDPHRCPTELADYIAAAVARSKEPAEA